MNNNPTKYFDITFRHPAGWMKRQGFPEDWVVDYRFGPYINGESNAIGIFVGPDDESVYQFRKEFTGEDDPPYDPAGTVGDWLEESELLDESFVAIMPMQNAGEILLRVCGKVIFASERSLFRRIAALLAEEILYESPVEMNGKTVDEYVATRSAGEFNRFIRALIRHSQENGDDEEFTTIQAIAEVMSWLEK